MKLVSPQRKKVKLKLSHPLPLPSDSVLHNLKPSAPTPSTLKSCHRSASAPLHRRGYAGAKTEEGKAALLLSERRARSGQEAAFGDHRLKKARDVVAEQAICISKLEAAVAALEEKLRMSEIQERRSQAKRTQLEWQTGVTKVKKEIGKELSVAQRELRVKEEELSGVLDCYEQEVEEISDKMTEIEKGVDAKVRKAIKETKVEEAVKAQELKRGEALAFQKTQNAEEELQQLKVYVKKLEADMKRREQQRLAIEANNNALEAQLQEQRRACAASDLTTKTVSSKLDAAYLRERDSKNSISNLEFALKTNERTSKRLLKQQLSQQRKMMQDTAKQTLEQHTSLLKKMEIQCAEAVAEVDATVEDYEGRLKKLKEDPNTILLPTRRATTSTDQKTISNTYNKQCRKLFDVLDKVGPEMLSHCLSLLKKDELKAGVKLEETYLDSDCFLKTKLMESFRKSTVVNTVDIIQSQWTANMEANCKVITGFSDEKINFWRDMHFKSYDKGTGKCTILFIEEDVKFPITPAMNAWKTILRHRKVALGLKCMDDEGTMFCLDFLVQAFKAHDDSVKEDNTLWTVDEPQQFVFSGDALQTAKGEKHNLCAIRSGLLKVGFSSALNFYPLTNAIGGDSWHELMLQLRDHVELMNKIVFSKQLCSKDGLRTLVCDLFTTGIGVSVCWCAALGQVSSGESQLITGTPLSHRVISSD